jgi:hypothetical protein
MAACKRSSEASQPGSSEPDGLRPNNTVRDARSERSRLGLALVLAGGMWL